MAGVMSGANLIRLSKSCLGEAEKLAVIDVLNREHLGMGKEVQYFENQLSDFLNRPVVCVANGTAALQLALQACGIGVGDEVLVQSLTYIATFQAISATGATPIACDIDPQTLCLDWRDAENRLTKKTKAVMPVHYSGGVGKLDEIYKFAKKNGLRVIEDAAHAFGGQVNGKKIGSFGDIACFSFDGIKNITSGEGGCVATDDEDILRYIRDARLLGVQRDTDNRFNGKRSWEFDVSSQGWRYHMSNIMAAIGIEQLKSVDSFADKRRKLAKQYDEEFKAEPRIQLMPHDYNSVVPHIYVVRIKSLLSRTELQDFMLNMGVETGVHYQPNHRLSFYADSEIPFLENTDSIYPELLTLPLHPDLSSEDIKYISSNLKGFVNNVKV